jgi:hypothetical protein
MEVNHQMQIGEFAYTRVFGLRTHRYPGKKVHLELLADNKLLPDANDCLSVDELGLFGKKMAAKVTVLA